MSIQGHWSMYINDCKISRIVLLENKYRETKDLIILPGFKLPSIESISTLEKLNDNLIYSKTLIRKDFQRSLKKYYRPETCSSVFN